MINQLDHSSACLNDLNIFVQTYTLHRNTILHAEKWIYMCLEKFGWGPLSVTNAVMSRYLVQRRLVWQRRQRRLRRRMNGLVDLSFVQFWPKIFSVFVEYKREKHDYVHRRRKSVNNHRKSHESQTWISVCRNWGYIIASGLREPIFGNSGGIGCIQFFQHTCFSSFSSALTYTHVWEPKHGRN